MFRWIVPSPLRILKLVGVRRGVEVTDALGPFVGVGLTDIVIKLEELRPRGLLTYDDPSPEGSM